MKRTKQEMDKRVYFRHSVKGPNIIFNGHTKLSMGIVSDTMMYSSYKNIQGQPVKWIDEIYEYRFLVTVKKMIMEIQV